MKTILLIEDDVAIRENTAELLELAGFAVFTAENGQLGVAQALRVNALKSGQLSLQALGLHGHQKSPPTEPG